MTTLKGIALKKYIESEIEMSKTFNEEHLLRFMCQWLEIDYYGTYIQEVNSR